MCSSDVPGVKNIKKGPTTNMALCIGRSRGGAWGPPYFQTKVKLEGGAKMFGLGGIAPPLSKGWDDHPSPLISRSGSSTTAVKHLNHYFCFLSLGFHLPVREKWAKMYKSVSQHNYLSIFLKILSFFRWKRFLLKENHVLKMVPIITSASVFNHLKLF